MTTFRPFSGLDLNPVTFGAGIGARVGTVITNNLLNGRNLTNEVVRAITNPSAPIIINNPPKSPLSLGFFDKTLITVGVVALGAVILFRVIK